MLRHLLYLVAGLAGLAAMLFLFKGLLYVADTQGALGEDSARSGPSLSSAFQPATDWDTEALDEVRELAAARGAGAVVILHDGRLAAEWGRTDLAVDWDPGRTTLISLLFGIARERGVLPTGTPSPRLGGDPRRADSVAVELERRTGRDLGALIDDWLAEPLGWTDFRPDRVTRDDAPADGPPEFSIPLSARDLARLGQAVLDGGTWQGAAVVPAEWLAASTTPREADGGGAFPLYHGDGWRIPASGEIEMRGSGGQRLRIDRRRGLVVVVGVLRGDDASERAVWTVMGDRVGGGEFRRLMGEIREAGGLPDIAPPLASLIEADEIMAAVTEARRLSTEDPGRFLFTESEMNDLGYALLRDGRLDEAIAVLALNAEVYDRFANPHDSLGEAYLERGDLERARTCY
ncbi:hypothetical protein GF314_03585, partial [bacterium]|nr:hypothetical protein [bacterium]